MCFLTSHVAHAHCSALKCPSRHSFAQNTQALDAWGAQSVKCLNLNFCSGHDFRVARSSSALGSMLGMEPALESVSLPLPLPLLCLENRADRFLLLKHFPQGSGTAQSACIDPRGLHPLVCSSPATHPG